MISGFFLLYFLSICKLASSSLSFYLPWSTWPNAANSNQDILVNFCFSASPVKARAHSVHYLSSKFTTHFSPKANTIYFRLFLCSCSTPHVSTNYIFSKNVVGYAAVTTNQAQNFCLSTTKMYFFLMLYICCRLP